MAVALTIREHNGRWSVSTGDDTEIVSFAGPRARERAERQRRELTDLLSRASRELPSRNSTQSDGND